MMIPTGLLTPINRHWELYYLTNDVGYGNSWEALQPRVGLGV